MVMLSLLYSTPHPLDTKYFQYNATYHNAKSLIFCGGLIVGEEISPYKIPIMK